MAAGNQEFIRDMNYRKILETIIKEGRISRAALAKFLGLTKATISSQVQTMLSEGLVEEIGSSKTDKGRRPILLKFRGTHAWILSFDIGLTHINLLLSDLLGQHCSLRQIPWNRKRETLPDLLTTVISGILEQFEREGKKAAGVCLGVHGVVRENEIRFTPYYPLEQLPLQEILNARFSLPVFIENEANLSALGEKTFSFGADNLVNISVHSGIGLGIILNGRLYTGADGFAGEFGHTIVKPQGLPCPCGNFGCLEQYASEAAVLRNYNLLKNTQNAVLEDFIRGYQHGETAATAAAEDFISYMALGINNLVNIFNPQLIVLNSMLTANLPNLIPQISGRLTNRMSRECRLVPSGLQDTATLLGGVYLCTRHYLGIETFCPPLYASPNSSIS